MATRYDNACDKVVHEPYLLNCVKLVNTLCSRQLWHLDRLTLQKWKRPLLKAQAQGTQYGRQIDATTREQRSATGVYITNTKASYTPATRRGHATKLVAKRPVASSDQWSLWSKATVSGYSRDCSCKSVEPIGGIGTRWPYMPTLILHGNGKVSFASVNINHCKSLLNRQSRSARWPLWVVVWMSTKHSACLNTGNDLT